MTQKNIWKITTFLLIILILILSIIIAYRFGNQEGFSSAIDFLTKTKVVGIGKIE